ncbi:recombinase RecT, partial [Acidaminococcus fermentans]|uniref:recombinase RecT n=2 Tax=Acidaminococcus TaxID=904 RepID=UPI00307A0E8B
MSEKGIVQQMIINMRPQFAAALPDVMSPERFIRLTLTAFSKTPKLYECTQASLLGALLMAAQLGMEPN